MAEEAPLDFSEAIGAGDAAAAAGVSDDMSDVRCGSHSRDAVRGYRC